jgi:hypothetical protein
MSERKPVRKTTPTWLLVADRYIAEIDEAERLDALAAADDMRRISRARCSALAQFWSSHRRHVGLSIVAQSRVRARDLTSSPAIH